MKHDLKALRALCDAAIKAGEASTEDSHFIAATDPQTVRALIDEIERLHGALEWIARVNACDYEYQRKAKQALGENDD